MTAIIRRLESSVKLFSDLAQQAAEDYIKDGKDTLIGQWSLGRSRAYELAATHFKNIIDIHKDTEEQREFDILDSACDFWKETALSLGYNDGSNDE